MGVWNCRRGLLDGSGEASSKLDEMRQFISKKKLHMMCVIEADLHSRMSRVRRKNTITRKEIEIVLCIPGFKIYLPATWKHHGQTRMIVYAREELKVNERILETELNDLPMVTLEVGFNTEKKTIVNFFYREFSSGVTGLGTGGDQMERLRRMIKHWRSLSNSNKDLVCLGDANLCAMRWNDRDYYLKEQADIVQTFLLETDSSQLVKNFTRSELVQGGLVSRSCIDHVYSNSPGKVSTPEVVSVGNSDHLGVVVTKFTRAPIIKPKVVLKRSYKDFKAEEFLKDIIDSDINNSVTNKNYIEEAAAEFENTFKYILDIHAPIKVFQIRKNYSVYLSDSTKRLMQARNSWKEIATKYGYKGALDISKELGKDIKQAVAKDREAYFNKDFAECSDRSNAWKTAKVILGMNNNLSPTAIKIKDNDGQYQQITNPELLAEMFNKYFKRKVEGLRQKTNQLPLIPPVTRLEDWLSKRNSPPPPFHLREIDSSMLRKILKRMKPRRTHGLDMIDSSSLKLAGPLIEDSLLHLINLSITQRRFSDRWKPQLIFPHHKKGPKDLIENYRPVSHLVQVGLMAEYAVYYQIVEHFMKHDLFHPNHHGSVANHSTATAIAQLYDIWLEAAERQELSAVCLLDQSAAYDLLCHQTLRKKLELYNFSEPSIEWLMSYLSERKQIVQVESKSSSPLEGSDHAVPQGSVLGGLLHVINSNDFPACHQEGESVVFVDDDSDTVSAKDPRELRDSIEREAENSAKWLKDNRLCVAGSKSKLLIIGTNKMRRQRIQENVKIVVDNKEIMETKSEKLLGLVINNTLTWENHLYGDGQNEGLIQQLSKRLGMLKLMSKHMKRENLKFFASGMFYSKMNYCLPVFGNVLGMEKYKEGNSRHQSYTAKDNQKLQVLQNNLNRILLKAKYDTPTEVLLKETNSLSIQQMIAYHTALLAYKIVKTNKPSYLAEKLQRRNVGVNLRGNKGSIVQRNKKLALSKEGFVYRGTALLNKLSVELRNEDKLEVFKAGLRKWVLVNIPAKTVIKSKKFACQKTETIHQPMNRMISGDF